nr:terminase small subunit [uncultured Anaerostipes sp.]
MPRTRNPNRDKAFEIYKSYNGKIDLVDIADQLQTSPGTVRGWKSKDKWEQKLNGTFRKNMERSKKQKAIVKEVEKTVENAEGLTDKQRLFCCHYIRCFNATKAYQKAYGVSYDVAAAAGSRLLKKEKIQETIRKLKQNRMNREMLSEEDIFQKYMDIAFADMTDYAEFGNETYQDPDTGKELKYSFVHLKDSGVVDGTLISEVSKGKDGAKIKLLDKMKAMQWLTDHMNMATEEQKARIEQMKAKTEQIRGADQNPLEDKVKKLFEAIGGALDEAE